MKLSRAMTKKAFFAAFCASSLSLMQPSHAATNLESKRNLRELGQVDVSMTSEPKANEFGGKQAGFCVRSDGQDQNSGVYKLESGDFDGPELQAYCLQKCAEFPNHTGCEAIWDQGNRGCYVHTEEVTRGNGVGNHACWIAK